MGARYVVRDIGKHIPEAGDIESFYRRNAFCVEYLSLFPKRSINSYK
jgi:hypothetical protein